MNVVRLVHAKHRQIRRMGGVGFRLKRPGVMQYPKLLQIWYQKQLIALMKKYREFLMSHMEFHIKRAIAEVRSTLPSQLKMDALRLDDWSDDLGKAFDDTDAQWNQNIFTPAQAEDMALAYAKMLSDFNRKQVEQSVTRMTGFDLFWEEPWLAGQMKGFAQENADLITKMDESTKLEISSMVFRAVSNGDRWETLAQDIQDRFEVGESRADLIGRDQTNKFNGKLNKLRQSELGITHYIWQGVMDERERDEHVDREGKEYAWNEPPADGNPGEPINCRCWGEPVIKLPEDDEDDESVFGHPTGEAVGAV